MKSSLRLAVFAPLLLTAGCSQFNPYLNPAQLLLPADQTVAARTLSLQLQSALINEANHYANEKATGALTLAGTLGFGAYKLATEGNAHQIAALAAGSGAVYGLSQAMYNQEVIVIIHETVSTLACLDGVYGDNGLARAAQLLEEIAKVEDGDPSVLEKATESFYKAKIVLSTVEDEYKSNVRIVASTYNRRRALHETDPQTIYQLISGAANSSARNLAEIPTQERKSNPEDNPELRKSNVAAPKVNKYVAELNAWIDWVKGLAEKDVSSEVKQCRSGFSPPAVPELGSANTVKTAGTFRLTNTSGNIGVSVSPDNGGIIAEATTSKGNLYLKIDGSGRGKVYVTDYGKDEALLVINVDIKQTILPSAT